MHGVMPTGRRQKRRPKRGVSENSHNALPAGRRYDRHSAAMVKRTSLAPNHNMTTQLPEKEFPSDLQRSAYQKCRDLECLALDNSNSSLQTTKPPALVAARLLGHLLLLVPNADGQKTLAKEIDNTSSHDVLIELAQFYINTFIKTCKCLVHGAQRIYTIVSQAFKWVNPSSIGPPLTTVV